MATQGIEEVTEDAIRAVARDCGSLSMECSDVAGYVQGVAERISDNLKMLDQLEEVTTRLMGDQARVSDSTDEARLLSEQARRGTGTHIASGHNRSARAIGMADRTPNFRASYEAEHTTPRLSRVPPTMSSDALPAPSGSTIRATATKNASASASRMRLAVIGRADPERSASSRCSA